MLTTNLRSLLLLALLGTSASQLGCATDGDQGPDQIDDGDVDGKGDGSGISSTDPSRLFDAPFYFSVPKSVVSVPLTARATRTRRCGTSRPRRTTSASA